MQIVVDCFGGDNCPQAAVVGGVSALEENSEIRLILCGKKDEIEKVLASQNYDKSRVEILDADDVITNSDQPSLAIRRKKTSSMVVGLRYVADGKADAFVSSGNTGALLVGATVIVRLLDGITRATLAPICPTVEDNKYFVLCDGGANVDCKPAMLKEFAIMGDAVMRSVFGQENPRIGLLCNGAEEEKGNELVKETRKLLAETNLNFVGSVEARDLMTNCADVVVADGFDGNVFLKTGEGVGMAIFELLKRNIQKGGLKAKIGYLLLKNSLRNVKHKMSSDEIGGAAFLGTKKIILKAHGSSNAKAFKNAILSAEKMAKNNLVGIIEKGLAENCAKAEPAQEKPKENQ
ncbi:MAG: phosphate acyltransferase PlsX [Clostridia bacterium]